jgi:hypothetical protein
MIDLVLALLSGAVGGLIIAFMPRCGSRLRNVVALSSSAAGAIFSWRVAGAVLAGRTIRIAGTNGGLAWSLHLRHPEPGRL